MYLGTLVLVVPQNVCLRAQHEWLKVDNPYLSGSLACVDKLVFHRERLAKANKTTAAATFGLHDYFLPQWMPVEKCEETVVALAPSDRRDFKDMKA